MSYILDALKKSEEQRNQGAVAIPGYHVQPAPAKKTKLINITIFLIAFFSIAAILLYYFFQQESGFDKIESINSAIEHTNNQKISTPTLNKGHREINSTISSIPVPEKSHIDSLPSTISTKPFDDALGNHSKTNKLEINEDQNLFAETSQESSESLIVDSGKVKNLNELDTLLQEQVPDLDYSSHWHDSNPKKSNIIINNQSLREGAWINSKIQIEKILINETIFKMDKQRFKLNSLQNWPG